MLEVHLLGTGGMVPLPGRYLTSLLVRYEGTGILVDCGEGTQMAIRAAGQGMRQIGVILLTHFHADHIAGLPGLLLTIGNSGRTEPLLIAGPRYVDKVIECLRIIARQLPYEIHYLEVPEKGGKVCEIGGLNLSAFPVEHWTPCYAYRFDLPRGGKFMPERANELDIPIKLWSILQRGEAVESGGRRFMPDEVLGPPRKGLSLCYATDMRPSPALARFADGSGLFVCEGMYGSDEQLEKAIDHRHCLFSEAAAMAKNANVHELWLTHFSPALPNPWEFLDVARAVFTNTFIDKTSIVMRFEE